MEQPRDSIRRARPLLGTFVEIFASGASTAELEAAVDAAFGAIAEVHGLMSFHDADSDVSRLNREASATAIEVHPATFKVLETALELHYRSEGIFDSTTAAALQRFNLLPDLEPLDSRHFGVEGNPRTLHGSPAETERKRVLSAQDGKIDLLPNCRVRFHSPDIRIDLGGIAKGFAVDRAIEILKERGIVAALVNAGGDLAAYGLGEYPIHIRDPCDPKQLLCEIWLRDEALATSGPRFDPLYGLETAWPAVIDPRTQTPAASIVGVTVCAPACTIADALTKVVMIAGEAAAPLLDHYGAKALMISAEASVSFTSGFQGALHRAA